MKMASVNRRVELEDENKFRITEQPIPTAPPGGAVIKMSFAGLCHSDVHLATDKNILDPNFVFPRVLGHESSGVVHNLGSDVTNFKVGDRVLIYPWVYCHDCFECRAFSGACLHERGFGTYRPGRHVYGLFKDGGYETFVLVEDAQMLVPVPATVAMDLAALIPCSGITSYNAVSTLRESVEGALTLKGRATIAMVGAGGLALWAIQIAKALYPQVTIVAIDILEDKIEDAKAVGADKGFCWSRDAPATEVADKLIQDVGYLDGAIDFTGRPSSVERAYLTMDARGTLVLIGLGASKLPTDMGLGVLMFRSIRLCGQLVGSLDHTKAVLKLVQEGKVKGPPITHVKLDQVPDIILGALANGTQRGRAVVKFD